MNSIRTTVFLLLLSTALSAQNALWRKALPNLWRQYDNLLVFTPSVAAFQQGEKWGLIHISGKILAPAQYDALAYNDNLPGYIQILSQSDQSWGNISGVINEYGKVIIPPRFRTIHLLPNGHLRACGYDKKCRDVTPEGKEVTPALLLKYFANGQEQDGLMAISEDGISYGLMDSKGRWVLQPRYPELRAIGNGWWNNTEQYPGGRLIHPKHINRADLNWSNTIPLKDGQYWHKKQGLWGKYDAKGAYIGALETDLVPIYLTNISPYRVVQLRDGYGLMDDAGQLILPPVHRWFQNAAKDSVFIITNQEGKQGGWKHGQWVIPQEYDDVFTAGKMYFGVKNNETDVYNRQFERISTVAMRFEVEQNNTEYFIDPRQINNEFNRSATSLFPEDRHAWSPEYGLVPMPDDALYLLHHYSALIARMADGTVAGIDSVGAIRLRAEDIMPVIRCHSGHGGYLFLQNGYWGFADHQWNMLIPAEYDELHHLERDRFAARKGTAWGVLKGNQWELSPQYEQYQKQNCFAALGRKGEWVLVKPAIEGVWDNLRCGKIGVDATVGTQKVQLSTPSFRLPEGADEMEPIYQDTIYTAMKSGLKALVAPGGYLLTPFTYRNIQPWLRKYRPGLYWATTAEGQKVILNQQGEVLLKADDVAWSTHRAISVKNGEKWRLYQLDFQPVGAIEALDKFVLHQGSGYLIYPKSTGVWGICTASGSEIHIFEADEVPLTPQPNEMTLRWRKGDTWYDMSLSDFSSAVRKYQMSQEYSYITIVQKNGLYGMNTPDGKVLFPCEYINIGQVYHANHFFALEKNDSIAITDQKGNIIVPLTRAQTEPLSPDYTDGEMNNIIRLVPSRPTAALIHLPTGKRLPNGHARIVKAGNRHWILSGDHEGRYNLYDATLQPVFDTPAVYLEQLSDSLFAVKTTYPEGPTRIFNLVEKKFWELTFQRAGPRTKGIWRAYNQSKGYLYCGSRQLIAATTNEIDLAFFSDVRVFMYRDQKGWTLFDASGKSLTAAPYDDITPQNDYYFLVKKQGKSGMLDKKGRVLIPVEYDEVSSLHPGLFIVKKDKQWGISNLTGTLLVPITCQRIKPTPDGFITVINGRYALYDMHGQPLFNRSWEYIDQFEEGLAAVRENGKWGYINRKGNIIIPCQFDYGHRFRPDWRETTVIKDGQFFDINHNGDIIRPMTSIPPYGEFFTPLELLPNADRYESYINLGNGFDIFIDKTTRKMGLINYAGTILLPATYDHLEYAFQPDVWLKGKKDGKTWNINLKLEVTPE